LRCREVGDNTIYKYGNFHRREINMNIAEQFAPIAALDLDPIKVKLMHEESGEGWTRGYADEVEFEYRRFLYLMKKFPNEQAAPLFDVDVFWHYHILDTMKYAADCEAVFGYFLHHFPYVGLRGEEDLTFHYNVGERMRELYEQTYGNANSSQVEPGPALGSRTSTAYSMPVNAQTLSVRTGRVAYSANVAYSMPAAVAYSMPSAKVAYSMPTAQRAGSSSTDGLGMGRNMANLPTTNLSHVRPTLAGAAA
jgi:hypothetical protein